MQGPLALWLRGKQLGVPATLGTWGPQCSRLMGGDPSVLQAPSRPLSSLSRPPLVPGPWR